MYDKYIHTYTHNIKPSEGEDDNPESSVLELCMIRTYTHTHIHTYTRIHISNQVMETICMIHTYTHTHIISNKPSEGEDDNTEPSVLEYMYDTYIHTYTHINIYTYQTK